MPWGKGERTGIQLQHPIEEHSPRSRTHGHRGDSAAWFKAILVQENFLHTQEQLLAGKYSRAGHSIHMKSQEICKKFSALWPGRESLPPTSQKCSPDTRNLGRSKRSSSNNASHLGQKKSLQLRGEARLLLTPQSCDRRRDKSSSRESPLSPHAGSQGYSITLPCPKPPPSSGHANRQRCPQDCLTSLGPCLPQSPPASRRSPIAWHLLSLLPWGRTKRSVWD